MLTDAIMYQALVEKDVSYEGTFIAAVKTTGIFCRPTCTARKPKPENVEFFETTKEAIAHGYRPCKVCNPFARRNSRLSKRDIERNRARSNTAFKRLGFAPERYRAKQNSKMVSEESWYNISCLPADVPDHCVIPFCHWGCPVENIIPEWNDAIYKGEWKRAIDLMHATNNFPEFTGRICPAPCEHACVLNIEGSPVTIRENEAAIAEYAFSEGYIKPLPPAKRSGKTVAIIGSGPAGLAAADQLNKAGHLVTVLEKSNAVGGLLRYGIPDFKLSKVVIDRRMRILEQEGIIFKTGTDVGTDITAGELLSSFDAICLSIGAMKPRNLPVEGRDLEGVYFAMDFLTQQNKLTRGETIPIEERITAKDKNVLIIGGVDTGSDCVGTSIRQGANKVIQIEILSKPPDTRNADNPWPYYGYTLKSTTSHQEGCERRWSLSTLKFHGNCHVEKAEVSDVEWAKNAYGKHEMKPGSGSSEMIDTDLVLLAMGFVHPVQEGLLNDLQVAYTDRNNVNITGKYRTSVPKVFAVGDAVLGASLVVRAIFSGRSAAKEINAYLSADL